MQEVKFEESWNKKRVSTAFIVLLLLAGGAVYLLKNRLPFDAKSERAQSQKVLSASDYNLEGVVQKQIESIKKEVNTINIAEIASSSSQIQKIINDVKSLEKLPQSQVKDACFRICGGL